MNPRTIQVTFDPNILPQWAKEDPKVMSLCRRDLAYRADVLRAATEQMKLHLKDLARRLVR
ncbi:MAG: hypothetical protein XU15_C0011G0164 [candidate division NC10 bacterium CSP1-5]|nr:MAG: hypothetical protein XU15_C0011G0020 [candidate division NC10 bacterium CSP1-5]KRT69482.1 MAG: hypothetical protein XU15_C0011G0164 [candidate division NC10 bacterium CSP1-5]